MLKAALGIFICASRRLYHTVQRDELSHDQLSHVSSC
jgi:hypothetical protein